MTFRSLDERKVRQQERWASQAEPSLKVQTRPSISEKPRAPGTVPILPVPKTRHTTASPCKLCNLARRVVAESIGRFIHVWTPKRSLHTHLCGTVHISAACVHKLGSCTTHRPHTPTTLEHHLRVRLISRRSKALHVSESKLAHNDIIVWGPQGVQTQVHPKALVVACPLPVAPLWSRCRCTFCLAGGQSCNGALRWRRRQMVRLRHFLDSPSAYMKPQAWHGLGKESGGRECSARFQTAPNLWYSSSLGFGERDRPDRQTLLTPPSSPRGHRIFRCWQPGRHYSCQTVQTNDETTGRRTKDRT